MARYGLSRSQGAAERRKQQNIETLGHLFGMDVWRIAAMVPANPPKQVQLTLAEKLAARQAQKEFAIAKLKELDPNWTPSRSLTELDNVH